MSLWYLSAGLRYTTKRFSVCVMGLGIMFALWTVPVSAQDKFTMGMLGVT